MAGTLYLVSTPIGNLEDITERALRILGEVDLVACEDTRHTQKLLGHFAIATRTISYHEHNERERAAELLLRLQEGKNVALVSDAGTPGISDPGFRLVQLATEAGVRVTPVPGPTALVAALIASGIPTDEFFFAGFLPPRSSARRARLQELKTINATLVCYEAPHRIAASLADARAILGEREVVVARELTKLHEEFLRGSLTELASKFADEEFPARGEMVIVIDRKQIAGTANGFEPVLQLEALVAEFEAAGLNSRLALKRAAKQLGLTRDAAYRALVAARSNTQREH